MDFLGFESPMKGVPKARNSRGTRCKAASRKKPSGKVAAQQSKIVIKPIKSQPSKAASRRSATRSVAKSGRPLLRVASACSGMCTESFALTKIGVPHTLVVACEIKPHMRKFIEHHHSPTTLLADVTSDEFAKSDGSDILTAGFPCQPFSAAGLQQGIADQRGRGAIIKHLISWLTTHLPAMFVLENVKGLLSQLHISTFINILKSLREIIDPDTGTAAYRVVWKVLNSIDFQTPQEPSKQAKQNNQVRAFCCAFLNIPFPGFLVLGPTRSLRQTRS
jgi:hypothetical protein